MGYFSKFLVVCLCCTESLHKIPFSISPLGGCLFMIRDFLNFTYDLKGTSVSFIEYRKRMMKRYGTYYYLLENEMMMICFIHLIIEWYLICDD